MLSKSESEEFEKFAKEFYPIILNKIEELIDNSKSINPDIPIQGRLSLIQMALEEFWLILLSLVKETPADFNESYWELIENRNIHRINHLKSFLINEKGQDFYNEFAGEYTLTTEHHLIENTLNKEEQDDQTN